ncbi:MAG: AAA family ATPase [Caldivirga sp.]
MSEVATQTLQNPPQAQGAQTPNAPNGKIEEARRRIQQVESILNQMVIGHENMVKALMVATVAGEHMVVIGPPGTAKSYTIRMLSKLLNAKFYSYLLTRFTSYDELFGTINVMELAKGQYIRNWSAIINSEFIFLDEVFKANSAILNALLSLLQERIVYDPMSGLPIQTSLWTAVGASNETPEDPELQALYDRFAVKVFISYLDNDAQILSALQARWLNSNNLTAVASMNDVRILNEYAMKLFIAKVKDLGEIYKLYHLNAVPLIKGLRSKGVIVSDRTIIEKLPRLFSAYLALYGVTLDNVTNAVYDLIVYMARNKDEVNAINKAIEESLGEVAELAKKLERAKEYIKAGNLQAAKEELQNLLNTDVSTIVQKAAWMRPRIEAIMSMARQYLEKVNTILQQIQQLKGEE